MHIGIAGIGGIGSNVARHLAQAGVPEITVVDFDLVEASNLNRQFYTVSQLGKPKTACLKDNLKQIFPEMSVHAINKKITPNQIATLLADCDSIVEGVDNKMLKKMIIEELIPTEKRIVSASGIAGRAMDEIIVKKMGNCFIVGDFTSDEDSFALFPPKVAMVAAIMAGIVLRGTPYA